MNLVKPVLKQNDGFVCMGHAGSADQQAVMAMWYHSRQKTLNQCWFDVGPTSTTLDQRYTDIDSMFCAVLVMEEVINIHTTLKSKKAVAAYPYNAEIYWYKPWRLKGFEFVLNLKSL